MNNGWIKIHRKVLEKGFYKDSHYVHLWVHLLIKANHKEKEFLFNNTLIKIKRGQFISGILSLSKETGINKSKVERILKLFENEKQIERQRTNKFSIFTIVSYDNYQESERLDDNQVRSQREASEKPVRTNKNEKNNKNEKKENIYIKDISEIIKYYNEKTGRDLKETETYKNAITRSLKNYSLEEICTAIDNMLEHEWWGDKVKADLLKVFRTRNKNGECDYIAEFQELVKENEIVDLRNMTLEEVKAKYGNK